MSRYSRRALLKASAALAGVSTIGFPSIVSGQTEKIKIGHLTPLTGFLGTLGAYAQQRWSCKATATPGRSWKVCNRTFMSARSETYSAANRDPGRAPN